MIERWSRLRTTTVQNHDDIRHFFDTHAPRYVETHGDADRLLDYRLALIRRYACFQPTDAVLEIGCGHGRHLQGLAHAFGSGIGVDLSPAMVQQARQHAAGSHGSATLDFHVDQGERLQTVADASMDVVFCVGVLEHIPDQARVSASVFRVLKPGGRFVCLTPNGHHLWYRWLAPWLRLETRHLSTDRFLTRQQLGRLLSAMGLHVRHVDYWTFIPRGDMHRLYAVLLNSLDWLGRSVAPDALRGGLVVSAEKRRSKPGKASHEIDGDYGSPG